MLTPLPPLAEITLPAPAIDPPMTSFVLAVEMPSPPLPSGCAPDQSVPIKLPHTTIESPRTIPVCPLPEITLPDAGQDPADQVAAARMQIHAKGDIPQRLGSRDVGADEVPFDHVAGISQTPDADAVA